MSKRQPGIGDVRSHAAELASFSTSKLDFFSKPGPYALLVTILHSLIILPLRNFIIKRRPRSLSLRVSLSRIHRPGSKLLRWACSTDRVARIFGATRPKVCSQNLKHRTRSTTSSFPQTSALSCCSRCATLPSAPALVSLTRQTGKRTFSQSYSSRPFEK